MSFRFLHRMLIVMVACTGMTVFSPSSGKDFILDLGGVLIDTDNLSSWWHIGPMRIFNYPVALADTTYAKRRFFEYLNHIMPHDKNKTPLYDGKGDRMPQLMCNWLTGTQLAHEIRDFIIASTKNHKSFFANKAERKLICSMAAMIFTPETFIKTRKRIKNGWRFVKECKERGHRVFILSNWDKQSFPLLIKQYADLFSLCDGIMISGNVQLVKPDPEIYCSLLETFKLNPANCIFIDDQQENIDAAQAVGIPSILCPQKRDLLGRTKPDFKTLRSLLAA